MFRLAIFAVLLAPMATGWDTTHEAVWQSEGAVYGHSPRDTDSIVAECTGTSGTLTCDATGGGARHVL